MTNTMNVINLITSSEEDFADIGFFLPDTFDYSKCYHDVETDMYCFLSDMSKLYNRQYNLDDQQKTTVKALADNNLCLLLEYSDTLKEKDIA